MVWRLVLLSADSAELRPRRLEVPATAVAGHRHSSPAALSRNTARVLPGRTRPRHRPAASVRRHRRNIRPSVKGGDPAAHFSQTGPAGKRPYSPEHIRPPAMSNRLTDRQQKNPLSIEILPAVPQAFPASTAHRAAALRAAPPAEAAALRRKPLAVLVSAVVAAAVSPRTPQEEEVSAVNPAAAVLAAQAQRQIRPVAAAPSGAGPAVRPGAPVLAAASLRRAHRAAHRKAPPPGAAVLAAAPVGVVSAAQVRKQIRLVAAGLSGDAPAVQPEGAALVVHLPESRKKRKCLRPAPQEQGRPHPLADLGSGQPAPSPAQQEWAPAVPSGLPCLNLGTAGISPRPRSRLRLGHRLPARHSRNSAGPPGETNPRCKAAVLFSIPAPQERLPAAPSGLPLLSPGTAGISPRLPPRPCPGHRAPVRYSRNSARFPGRTSFQ